MRILIADDSIVSRHLLEATLHKWGYEVAVACDGLEAWELLQAENAPRLAILDWVMPGLTGLEVCKRVRESARDKETSYTYILLLTSKSQREDLIEGMESGADDYLTKPFGSGELLARIRVALRHSAMRRTGQKEVVFTVDELRVDLASRHVFFRDKEVHLTPIEYRLLTALVHNAGKVMTHAQLLKQVWGPAYADQQQYLHVYMAQLRKKIEADPARPRLLINEPGVGYRLKMTV